MESEGAAVCSNYTDEAVNDVPDLGASLPRLTVPVGEQHRSLAIVSGSVETMPKDGLQALQQMGTVRRPVAFHQSP